MLPVVCTIDVTPAPEGLLTVILEPSREMLSPLLTPVVMVLPAPRVSSTPLMRTSVPMIVTLSISSKVIAIPALVLAPTHPEGRAK